MSAPKPNSISLQSIADGSQAVAADLRNNYTSIQDAVNDLIAILALATVKGDLVIAEGGGVFERLGIGSDNQVLTADSSQPTGAKWATPAGGGASTPTPATTLPGSPTNGQQAILVDNTATPTFAWLLQYSTTASKWLFVGGAPLASAVATSEALNSTSYGDLSTVGPSVTVPRAGSYICSFGCTMPDTGGNELYAAPKFGSASTSDTDALEFELNVSGTISVARTLPARTLATSDVVKLQYRAGFGGPYNVSKRWLQLLPVTLT